ncbi:hypothetical protein TNCV_4615031 [Trichonephila clavipes]|nr:hypothetical protein TNCV_4615031 [Trichonephila clavipes]
MQPRHRPEFYARDGQGRLNRSSVLQWVDKRVPSLLGDLNTGGSFQTDHQIGTSAHAPQRPTVTNTRMDTVGFGPHGLLRH